MQILLVKPPLFYLKVKTLKTTENVSLVTIPSSSGHISYQILGASSCCKQLMEPKYTEKIPYYAFLKKGYESFSNQWIILVLKLRLSFDQY